MYVGVWYLFMFFQDQVCDIFVGMGWEIVEGLEFEYEWFNFDVLNFDVDYLVCQEQDIFYVDLILCYFVMCMYMSLVQVCLMFDCEVLIYVLCFGCVYCIDEFDVMYFLVFMQFEGFVIDKGIMMVYFKGIFDYFVWQLFGLEVKMCFCINYFFFIELFVEFDLWYLIFKGGVCWIEWGGCGMVNFNVLCVVGIDLEEYSGFVFGMGIECGLMFCSDVQDMWDMVEGDV